MEIPQRVMVQTLVYGLLMKMHMNSVWSILITALIWCASILVQAFFVRQKNIRHLIVEVVASFVFSMGIGYVFYSSGCILIPMLAHGTERYITRRVKVKMNENLFSEKYDVRKMNNKDVNLIYELCRKNDIYYEFCPPFVTHEGIRDDLVALPDNITSESKYYVGYFENEKLVAVLDLIEGYPDKGKSFIGFFMTDVSTQNEGIGSEIITELLAYLRLSGCQSVQLAWVKGNPQAEHFWLKNGFIALKETSSTAADSVILAEKLLN